MGKKELIVVEQLPIIREQLKNISAEIDLKISHALSLVCTEDTVKEIKALRAELNKDYADLEDKRKQVKTAIMTPYEKFNAIYKEFVSDKYNNADITLKDRITEVENAVKKDKTNELRAYFDEYLQSKNIDFVTYETAGINVTLSTKINPLKKQVRAFIDRIVEDLALIDTQEHKEEILVEYKSSLNVSNAITSVMSRHKAINAEKLKTAVRFQTQTDEAKAVEKIESLVAPIVEETTEEQEETLLFKFFVEATKGKLKELIVFMKDNGYIFGDISED